jgi:hypothetical protein
MVILFAIKNNRKRIFKERLSHYLYKINLKNHARSKKWWSFIIPKKYKSPVVDVSEKLKKKMECNWGDVETLKRMQKLCITGHDIQLSIGDMEKLIEAENANNWKSGAVLKTTKEISDIWA